MFYVKEIRINKSGYDRTGQYWGVGQRLYGWQYDGDLQLNTWNAGHLRANDREDAKQKIRDYFRSDFGDHIVFAR